MIKNCCNWLYVDDIDELFTWDWGWILMMVLFVYLCVSQLWRCMHIEFIQIDFSAEFLGKFRVIMIMCCFVLFSVSMNTKCIFCRHRVKENLILKFMPFKTLIHIRKITSIEAILTWFNKVTHSTSILQPDPSISFRYIVQ